jgi:hypothetical protein
MLRPEKEILILERYSRYSRKTSAKSPPLARAASRTECSAAASRPKRLSMSEEVGRMVILKA